MAGPPARPRRRRSRRAAAGEPVTVTQSEKQKRPMALLYSVLYAETCPDCKRNTQTGRLSATLAVLGPVPPVTVAHPHGCDRNCHGDVGQGPGWSAGMGPALPVPLVIPTSGRTRTTKLAADRRPRAACHASLSTSNTDRDRDCQSWWPGLCLPARAAATQPGTGLELISEPGRRRQGRARRTTARAAPITLAPRPQQKPEPGAA